MTAHAVFAVGQVPNDSVGIGFRHGEVLGRADLATDMGRDSNRDKRRPRCEEDRGMETGKRIAEVWWFGAVL